MKTIPHTANTLSSRRNATGVALVVALVFLLVLTLVGVASLQGNMAQERMSYAFGDYTRAFQAADSTVTEGEYWLNQQSYKPIACSSSCGSSSLVWATTGGNGTSQFSLPNNLTSISWWSTYGLSFSTTYSQFASSAARTDDGLSRVGAAQYVIEEMGPDPNNSLVIGVPTYKRWYYRVSGHGTGALSSKGMDATAQSTYVQGYGS